MQAGMFVATPNFSGEESQLSAFEHIVRQHICELVAATEDQAGTELVSFVKDLLLFKS
jgi:hypothetical protein